MPKGLLGQWNRPPRGRPTNRTLQLCSDRTKTEVAMGHDWVYHVNRGAERTSTVEWNPKDTRYFWIAKRLRGWIRGGLNSQTPHPSQKQCSV